MLTKCSIEAIVFEDEITLWWKKDAFVGADAYRLYLDGTLCGMTDKTHYTFSALEAARAYSACVEALRAGEVCGKWEETLTTGAKKRRLDVTKAPYNAVADGSTPSTAALQRALDDCGVGDCVYFPSGVYLSGALDVHSNTEIYLDTGAELRGSARAVDYLPKIESRFEGTHMMCYRSLINMGKLDRADGYSCENVVLRGHGRIFGGGRALGLDMQETEREALKSFLAENADYVKTCENEDTIPGRVRGRLINASNCKGVVVAGLELGYAASWNLHFVYCKNVVTYGCRILSHNLYDGNGEKLMDAVWNGDGWNPDSSEDCAVFDTYFNTYDNSIAIKSGKNPEGNVIGRPSKNICVFDCHGKDIAIGSEMSGGVEDVFVWDSEFVDGYGVNVKATRDRGGYIRNLHVRDCRLTCVILRTRINCNNDGEGAGTLSRISSLSFENLELTGEYVGFADSASLVAPVFIDAFDEEEGAVEDVMLTDVRLLPSALGAHLPCYFHNVRNLRICDSDVKVDKS